MANMTYIKDIDFNEIKTDYMIEFRSGQVINKYIINKECDLGLGLFENKLQNHANKLKESFNQLMSLIFNEISNDLKTSHILCCSEGISFDLEYNNAKFATITIQFKHNDNKNSWYQSMDSKIANPLLFKKVDIEFLKIDYFVTALSANVNDTFVKAALYCF